MNNYVKIRCEKIRLTAHFWPGKKGLLHCYYNNYYKKFSRKQYKHVKQRASSRLIVNY